MEKQEKETEVIEEKEKEEEKKNLDVVDKSVKEEKQKKEPVYEVSKLPAKNQTPEKEKDGVVPAEEMKILSYAKIDAFLQDHIKDETISIVELQEFLSKNSFMSNTEKTVEKLQVELIDKCKNEKKLLKICEGVMSKFRYVIEKNTSLSRDSVEFSEKLKTSMEERINITKELNKIQNSLIEKDKENQKLKKRIIDQKKKERKVQRDEKSDQIILHLKEKLKKRGKELFRMKKELKDKYEKKSKNIINQNELRVKNLKLKIQNLEKEKVERVKEFEKR